MAKLLPVFVLAMCLGNVWLASIKIDEIKSANCPGKSAEAMERLVKESVKLIETAEERNLDVSSCKWELVTLKTIDTKTFLESGNALRDAIHSVNAQLAEKNSCMKSLLGLRG